jgi:hypothetical protein
MGSKWLFVDKGAIGTPYVGEAIARDPRANFGMM